ncbi:aminoglycoside 6'-N-acetyltransferase [Salinicoccus sesuvii]|uniref:Aminoglycoside N(6')-acetyltransferase type 1 n=1 Tax=Salinicoccus sesuvii TaxID=868281 RepID=A0ABV7N5Z3_9STAP
MIRHAQQEDVKALLALAIKLWPGHSDQELENDFKRYIQADNDSVFIAEISRTVVGFAHCSLRIDYVAGASNSPVAFLEGIYVEECHRCKGYARKLVEACEQWGREKGASDFGSDCLLDNETSIEMHHHLGFKEIERTISFHKRI